MADNGFDYEAYEKECESISAKNEEYLEGFAEELSKEGLSEKTIKKHVSNVDFYINYYLLYEDATPAEEGCGHAISFFLGYWFIKKAMWSSVASIRSNAASIKKFYKYLLKKGVVQSDDYDSLLEIIKEEMPEWLEEMLDYDAAAYDW